MAARAPPKLPVIAVVGATGTGKSQVCSKVPYNLHEANEAKLAIEIAKKFNGEVINADAMQLYRGLPVITNKVTEEERSDVPHYLLGDIGLDQPTWTVGRFVESATKCLQDIHKRGKLPIVVGGTHYYTQALLLGDGIVNEDADHKENADESSFMTEDERAAAYPILQEDTPCLLAELRKVDPVMADRWHPNDRRKIQRSLEIYLRTGKTASATYEEQKAAKVVNGQSGTSDRITSLAHPSLVLWLHCEHDVLRDRLDKRVDKMLEAGLLDEIAELSAFYEAEQSAGKDIDLTRGIWVSIGYKEFQAYQAALTSGDTSERELQRLKQQAIEATRAATRQYAKRQIRWIRVKLLNALQAHEDKGSIYLLDGSDLSRWNEDVRKPAHELVEAFLAGKGMPTPETMSKAAEANLKPKRHDMSQRPDLWQRRECEACSAVFVTESSWETHIKSKGHRYHIKRLQIEAEKKAVGDVDFH